MTLLFSLLFHVEIGPGADKTAGEACGTPGCRNPREDQRTHQTRSERRWYPSSELSVHLTLCEPGKSRLRRSDARPLCLVNSGLETAFSCEKAASSCGAVGNDKGCCERQCMCPSKHTHFPIALSRLVESQFTTPACSLWTLWTTVLSVSLSLNWVLAPQGSHSSWGLV